MVAMSYVGTAETLPFSVKDETGVPTDPTDVTLTIRRPNGVVFARTMVEVEHPSVGEFFYLLQLDEAGAWQFRWNATGNVEAVLPGTIAVATDPIATAFSDPNFTVADIWVRSPYLQGRFASASDAALEFLVGTTAPLVGSMTGREIAGTEGEPVPPSMIELERQAIALKAETLDRAIGSKKLREASIARTNLAGFSAGSYSEHYFGTSTRFESAKTLDPDPVLAEMLWALATEQRRLEWLVFWDPANYHLGEGSIESFEYGNRPNYSPAPGYYGRGGTGWWW